MGPLELSVLFALALVTWMTRRRMAEVGVKGGSLLDFSLGALLGGAVGSRLFYAVPLWIRGQMSGAAIFSDWGQGAGYYGALAGGTLGLSIVALVKKVPVLRVLDAVAAPLPAGFALTKVGCILAGCCYGQLWAGGLSFPPGSLAYDTQRSAGAIPQDAARSLPVHPAQIYEFVLAILLFGVLMIVQRRSKRAGDAFFVYLAGYSVVRFVIEFVRDDPGRHAFGASALSDSQIAALIVFGLAAAGWAALRAGTKNKEQGTGTVPGG
jgi:phosphatidylglycerol:prolipoprotein diacylglycerol transferase